MADTTSRIAAYRTKKPKSTIKWETFEIYQENGGLFRFVKDFTNQTFTLEAGAPNNPSEAVEFRAINFDGSTPSQTAEPQISIEVSIQRVGSEIKSALKQMIGFAAYTPIEFTWREFMSDDTSEPVQVYYLYVQNISLARGAVTIVATDENPLAQTVSDIATTVRFPGLIDL